MRRDDLAEYLYREYSALVRNYARKKLHDEYLADEIVSETYLKVCDALTRGIGPEEGKERGWLFTIAHNNIVDQVRDANKKVSILSGEALAWISVDGVEMQALDRVELQWAMDALDRINDNQSRALKMWMLGVEIGDIAERMDRSEGAVRSMFHRGREQLRRWRDDGGQ